MMFVIVAYLQVSLNTAKMYINVIVYYLKVKKVKSERESENNRYLYTYFTIIILFFCFYYLDQDPTSLDYMVGYVWPDTKTVFPDFFKPESKAWWSGELQIFYDVSMLVVARCFSSKQYMYLILKWLSLLLL